MAVPTTDAATTPVRADATDRLTGLADRDRFAHQLDQVDRDRDRLLVAVIAIDGLAEVNQLCGYDAGDDLLRHLGRVLVQRGSVDVLAARTGPSAFGVLVAPAEGREPQATIEPIVADLTRAVDRWLTERSGLGEPSPITPTVRAGVADGYGAQVWADAEVALSANRGGVDGPALLRFDRAHPRLADHRRRQRVAADLVDALVGASLPVEATAVEPLEPGAEAWTRLRLGSIGRRSTDPDPLDPEDLAAVPGLGGRLDHHLIDRAIQFQAGSADDRPGPRTERVAVPLLGPVAGPHSLLADPLLAWAGLIVEVDQATLRSIGSTGGPDRSALADRLHELSWDAAVDGFDGGWQAWHRIEGLPIHHLRLDSDLVAAATPGTAALRLLAATAEAAAAVGRPLVAPPGLAEDGLLRELGVTHVERAASSPGP